MDTKMKRELNNLLTKYPGGSQLNFSDPFMWAGAIRYIVTNWRGQSLTHEDVRLAIANHIIMRMNRLRSQPYPQQQLNPPLYPLNPTQLQQINANRTMDVLNQYLGIPPQPLPFPDVGIEYPPRPIFRPRVLAPPARPLPPGVPPPVFSPGQECISCTEEITGLQAQNPGIAFCTSCSGRTHLSCYNSMSLEERDLFFLKRKPSDQPRCPTKCSTNPEWYEYQFSPAEIAAAVVPPPVLVAPRDDAAEIINAQDRAYDEALRLDSRRWNIEELLERPEFVDQTPEQLARALTAYRSDPRDNGITQEEFNTVVERLKKNKGGKKIRHNKHSNHIKHSKSNKRSNKKRRSYRKKNKTGKKRLYKRRQTKKRNSGNNGGGRLPVFEKLERGISIPNLEEDRDPNFWLRQGMINAKSRKIMDNRLDTIDAESRRRQDDQAMSGCDTDTD